MFHRIELLSIGLAAVLDTVLLVALLERRNWRYLATAILTLVVGAWLWHTGAFASQLLVDMTDLWARDVHLCAMVAMSAGLLLIPSALIHACWRLANTGFEIRPGMRGIYALAYLPLLLLAPLWPLLAAERAANFLDATAPLVKPYAVYLGVVNIVAGVFLFAFRRRIDVPRAAQFLTCSAIVLFALGVVQSFVLLHAIEAWPEWRPYLSLLVVLSPVSLALLFGYFVLRFRFMQLMVERTIVYGAIVAAAMLFHRVMLQGSTAALGERFQIDFGVLEGVLVLALVVVYPPLRRRSAEALRYLLGSPVAEVRKRSREMALRLSNLSGQPPRDVLAWFVDTARELLGLEYVAGWLFDCSGTIVAATWSQTRLTDDDVVGIRRFLAHLGQAYWTYRDLPDRGTACLEMAEASLAVALEQPGASGLVVFGRRRGNREFGEEETNSLVLLTEQLGITLRNSVLQAERLAHERRALEREKLSTLGLLASSIAHEVKNPLSSIKTIATVMAEQLGSANEHAEDLKLILGEIDRLATTTTQLLSFARPANGTTQTCSVSDVLKATLGVMRHLANGRGVTLELQLPAACPAICADENAVREVFFNLIANSIEVSRAGGRVSVVCHAENGHVLAQVRDTGPGIPPEVQDRLFQPFVTTKPTGTGLGLYIVGRRVQEMGGEIHCQSDPGQGTLFTIKLPIVGGPTGQPPITSNHV
ncbi:MAG: hypothetical protein HYX69_20050 [Planctomycetia bacterium]|nr:hypothetical protein [Planctomycetia bacterium]